MSDLMRQLEATRDSLAELWEAIDGGQSPANQYAHDDAYEELHERPLEIVWEKGEPFSILLAFGGPNIRIEGGGREGGYVMRGWWGGDYAELRDESITRTGDYFRSLYEESDQ